jgi:hypothetical protein
MATGQLLALFSFDPKESVAINNRDGAIAT